MRHIILMVLLASLIGPALAQKPTGPASPRRGPVGPTGPIPIMPEIALLPQNSDWRIHQTGTVPPSGIEGTAFLHIIEYERISGDDGPGRQSLQLNGAPFSVFDDDDPLTAQIELLKTNDRTNCVNVSFRDFEYATPSGETQIGFESTCTGFRNPISHQTDTEKLIVTLRRFSRGERNINTLQRAWEGTPAGWSQWIAVHPSYTDDWNRDLDRATICHLPQTPFDCPPLTNPSVEIMPETEAAIEQVNARGIAGTLTIRPARTADIRGEPAIHLIPIERELWQSTEMLTQIATLMITAAIQYEAVDLILVYSEDPPTSVEDRAQVRMHVANLMHWMEIQIWQVRRIVGSQGVPVPDLIVQINVNNDR